MGPADRAGHPVTAGAFDRKRTQAGGYAVGATRLHVAALRAALNEMTVLDVAMAPERLQQRLDAAPPGRGLHRKARAPSRLLMVPPGRGMARRHRSGKPVTSSADHPVATLSVNDAVGDEQDG